MGREGMQGRDAWKNSEIKCSSRWSYSWEDHAECCSILFRRPGNQRLDDHCLGANTVARPKLRVLFPEALRIAKSKFSDGGTKNYPNITTHKLGSSQGSGSTNWGSWHGGSESGNVTEENLFWVRGRLMWVWGSSLSLVSRTTRRTGLELWFPSGLPTREEVTQPYRHLACHPWKCKYCVQAWGNGSGGREGEGSSRTGLAEAPAPGEVGGRAVRGGRLTKIISF